MDITEFYEKLKQCLENEMFKEILLSKGDVNSFSRRLFLVKSLYFLISIRDFDNFEKFLNTYYSDIFPYQYLKEKNNLSDEAVKSIIYDNFIRNGFLFHVTPSNNVDEILTNGLQTLNDKYKCDLYKKSLEVNETYSKIRARNSKLNQLFKMPSIVNIPGIEKYREDRFTTVYLSSNLEYILKNYGESGELFALFIRDLLWAFNNSDDVDTLTKAELKNRIVQIIKNSNAEIYDEEITQILDFIETIYEDRKNEFSTKSILLVPTSSITSKFTYFDKLYKKNDLNLSVETILDMNDGEIGSVESIPPNNIITINTNKDNSLSLKIKR